MINDTINEALTEAMADIESQSDISHLDGIKDLAPLVNKLIDLEALAEKAGELTKKITAAMDQLRDRQVPDLMLEMNIKKWTTTNGFSVSISELYFPAVNKIDMPEFVGWLKERGDEGIVKPKLTVDFGKGLLAEAEEAAEAIKALGYAAELSPEIHWATFRSFARELAEKGDATPPCYSVHSIHRATVKKEK